MARKKTGKPQALELAEDEDALPPPPEPTLDEFLREMHQTTTQGEDVQPQSSAAPAEGKLPSLDWLKQQFKTKSASIRYLISQGHPRAAIAKHLGVKYQMVRNVDVKELKRGPNEDWHLPGGSGISPALKSTDS